MKSTTGWFVIGLALSATLSIHAEKVLYPKHTSHLVGKAFPENADDLPTMPNVEYALRGYNLLVGNPLASGHEADPGFDNVIFEATYSGATTADLRYRIPDGYSVFSKTICNVNFMSNTYSSERKYQKELKIPVNVNFDGWDAAFTANFEYREITNQMSSYEHSFVKTESTCGVYEVVMDTYQPPKIRSGFLAAAKSLQGLTPDSDQGYLAYKRFVETYGTHYIYSTHMGAKYAEQTEFTKTSRNSLESEGINLNLVASYAALFNLGITTDVVIDTETVKKFEEAAFSKNIVSFGSRPPSDGSAISWTNSVFDEPLPISYRLLPVTDLFTAHFMGSTDINFEQIHDVLKDFIKDYCTNEQDSLGISDCNGPRGGCAGGHECHHNAHCVDTDEKDDYVCSCNDDYFGDGFSCSGWNIQTLLEPDVHGAWGDWGEMAICPNMTYAYAFSLKVEDKTDDSWVRDDSALNGVKLYCRSADGKLTGEVTSSVGNWGSWRDPLDCFNGFMTGFRFRAEGDIVGDDVGATNMDGHCQSGQILEGTGINQWGSWSSWTYCPPEAAICGIQTKVHPPQGDLAWEDDVGLTDIKVQCCQI